MTNRKDLSHLLIDGASELGLDLNEEAVSRFLHYLFFLEKWNKKFNLTSIESPREVVIKHFLDSLMCADFLNGNGKAVDVGSGAGFPGIVLKIYRPDLEIALIETSQKKAHFLGRLINELKLQGIYVVEGRAEDIARENEFRESFDFAVSRAVGELNLISEYSLPLVKVGGIFLAYKGFEVGEEVKRAEKAVKSLGGEISGVFCRNLPFTGERRKIIRIDKIGSTPAKFPRKAGIPKKRPL